MRAHGALGSRSGVNLGFSQRNRHAVRRQFSVCLGGGRRRAGIYQIDEGVRFSLYPLQRVHVW